jgi:SAM-dependent methyltransferase
MASDAVLTASRERWARPLFVATIVTGSFLLFLTQPMIARMALPRLGGAPAVWNSAMLVYQALLLGGYAYAHWIGRLPMRRQAGLHLGLFAIAALWLPIGLLDLQPPPDFAPAVWVPWFLVASIGPLFFIVSAQAPLMQRWYAAEKSRGEPYALYAASNLGSFAGLISYPLLVEPLLTLKQQSLVWTGGYALLVALVAGCALTIPPRAVEEVPVEHSPKPSRRRILHWIALAAVPSGLMLSTTTHLTTDIVAIPLLWVLPLGLYLLSFVVAFAHRRGLTEFISQLAPLIILIAGGLAFSDGSQRPIFSATLGLSLLFFVAVTLHGEMYRLRPAADHLTAFYLSMSVGGVLGGALCAVLAPTIFDWTYEHPLLVLAAALLIPQRAYLAAIEGIWSRPRVRLVLTLLLPSIVLLLSLPGDQRFWPGAPDWAAIASPVLIAISALFSIGRPTMFATCLLALMMSYGGWSVLKLSLGDTRDRSYFGVYTVSTRPGGSARVLTHGTTVHGVQSLRPGLQREPTSYYTRLSGVGLAMAGAEPLFGPAARIGVVGLGTGTLACYRVPGQSWTFYEIDPAIVKVARDPRRFTFLSGCAPDARVVLGDARLSLARQPSSSLDLLAVDAFSSDAVPMHLLTREAIDVYGRALQPSGLLMMHISNRYLDLKPVLAANAAALGWQARLIRYDPTAKERLLEDAHPSVWVAMSRDPATLDSLVRAGPEGSWEKLRAHPDFPGWSDDYASIIPLLRGLTR